MKKITTSFCTILALLASLCVTTGLQAQITGTVFRDYNGNGTRDTNEPLMPGVTVNAYDATNALCGTATTAGGSSTPNYSLAGCGTGSVRVEFVLPTGAPFVDAAVDYSALSGVTYGTSVQFVNGNSTNVNFAISDPDDYNTGPADVDLYIPCYVNGDPLPAGSASGAMDWFIGYPYENDGASAPTPAQKLNGSVIGSTFGVAYSKQANRIFTSAFLKRHVGLGVMGTGGIYMLEPTATSFNVTQFYDMDANGHRTRAAATAVAYGRESSYQLNNVRDGLMNTTEFSDQVVYLGPTDPVSGQPEGMGVVGTNVQRGLSTVPTQPSFDPAARDQVGKVGLGGLEISDDGRFLFVVNLYSRSVFRLELDDAYNPTSVVSVAEIAIPETMITCPQGELRPFGLTYNRGKLYVGAVCTGEYGDDTTLLGSDNVNPPVLPPSGPNLFAHVFVMDNPYTSTAFTASPILSQALDYSKGASIRNCGASYYWHSWTNRVIANCSDGATLSVRSVPVLSDIEFANNGQMILNFFDRTGHVYGDDNYRFLHPRDFGSNELIGTAPGGEIWAAGLNAGTGMYELENAGGFTTNGLSFTSVGNGCYGNVDWYRRNGGLGGDEFFSGDWFGFDIHSETAVGSSAYLPGQSNIKQTVYDPDPNNNFAGGTRNMSLVNGGFGPSTATTGFYELFADGAFGKSNGLGELELMSPPPQGCRI